MSFFKKRTRVQQPDKRSHTERTRDLYTGMEVQLQNRIDMLKDTISRAQDDLRESEAILASVHAAQKSLETFIEYQIDHYEEQIALSVTDLRVDETDPSLPMGENGNVRVD